MTDPSELYSRLVSAFRNGCWNEAWALCEALLPHAPRHAGVQGIAGIVSMELQQPARAVPLLRKATELDPSRADFATLYAKALSMDRRASDALLAADRALPLVSADPMTLDVLGVIYTQHRAHARAVDVFRKAVALAPNQTSIRFNLATSLVAMGHIDDAEREFEACIALNPSAWRAHLSLTQLRKQLPNHNHIERLRTLLVDHPHDSVASTFLNMALAKEYEDLGEYGDAFSHLVLGKSSARTRPYSFERDKAMFEALTDAFAQPDVQTPGDPTNEPIFVMGMPRTGTTLVTRMLSSHPEVCDAGELQNFAVALQHAVGNQNAVLFDPTLATLTQRIDWQQLGATYLTSTRPITGHTSRFIDKLPHNFLYAGFIARALPNAKMICLRRDPMDCCLSNYRQLFEQPSLHFDYSYDLQDTGRYYVLFDRLMAHWQRVLPGRILEVSYEELTEAPESVVRRMLAFCGLPWSDACLHFEDNPEPIATYSAVQARSPLYRSAVGRWRCYETELADLRDLLRQAGIESAT